MSLAATRVQTSFSLLEASVVRRVLYFEIFRYPLSRKDITNLVKGNHSDQEVEKTIGELLMRGVLTEHNGFLSVGLSEEDSLKRQSAEQHFESVRSKIERSCRRVARFPFVRGVALSGAVSKGLMTTDGDVDFFIITKPGRLWLCRTLMVAYKKIFLLNSRKYFCVNYFIDTDHLALPDQNVFTATELAYLLPTYGMEEMDRFRQTNGWYQSEYPEFEHPLTVSVVTRDRKWFKGVCEWMLGGWVGRRLNRFCYRITLKRWRHKFGHMSDEEFELALRSEDHVSKHHPSNFQTKVLEAYQEGIATFERKHGLLS